MVRLDAGIGTARPQTVHERGVEGLDGAPGPLEEVVAPAHDVAARGHARRGADPMVVEDQRVLSERVEMRRMGGSLGVVTPQRIPAKGVHQHQDRSHASALSL